MAGHYSVQRGMPSSQTSDTERAAKIGRAVGFLVLGLLVSAFTAVCTFEIIRQLWFQDVGRSATECRAGLARLTHALERARSAGHRVQTGGNTGALARFRASLDPAWEDKTAVAQACRGDPRSSHALKQIEQLRYAEERAVRYEARSLSRQRRQVQKSLSELGLSSPYGRAPAPSSTRAP